MLDVLDVPNIFSVKKYKNIKTLHLERQQRSGRAVTSLTVSGARLTSWQLSRPLPPFLSVYLSQGLDERMREKGKKKVFVMRETRFYKQIFTAFLSQSKHSQRATP